MPGTSYTSPDTSLAQLGRGRGSLGCCSPGSAGRQTQRLGRRPHGCRWLPAKQVCTGAGGQGGKLLGAQNLASRGGDGAEAATNRGSARIPLPAANHRSVSPSLPPRPLFPLALWPPRVSGPTTSVRAGQAMCTRGQGPLGGVLASPSDGMLVVLHTQPHLPRVALEGRDKALRRRTLAWGGEHGM